MSVPPAFDADLIRKYDRFGPRYTSYPTADRFIPAGAAKYWANALLERRAQRSQQPLSLYVHLPFCDTICYYCACNKVITKDHSRSAQYLSYLAKEVGIVAELAGGAACVAQLHWGGGTPTFLSAGEMVTLMGMLRERFPFDPDAECSIEIDPRNVTRETIALLAGLGFTRLSLGVQDFDPDVQLAVNRIQSEELTLAVLEAARQNGFRSLNIDLIYGLPRQTIDGFERTLDKVIAAAPDRIALYSYAHVPHLFKPQRRIGEVDLPSPVTKLAILALAIERLTGAGYVYIGMDHFAKHDDELALAQQRGQLHRNFQGYSTHAGCDLLSFGVSAIGRVASTYAQNVRTLAEYYERLDAGALPSYRGWQLSADDRVRGAVIQALMCHCHVDVATIEAAHGIVFGEYFAAELEALRPLAADGLVEVEIDRIAVTARGRLLVRTAAMAFDRFLREQRGSPHYSRVI